MNLKLVRRRLFAMQLLGLLLLLALLVSGAYALLRSQLYHQLEEKLLLMGQAVTFSVEHESNGPHFEESMYLASRKERVQLGNDAVAQWLDLRGHVVHSQGNLALTSLPPVDGQLLYVQGACIYTALGRDSKGVPFGYARVAMSLGPMTEELAQVLRALVVTGASALALTALASWWWIGRLLSPVQKTYQELETFAGSLSHELRTPVSALRLQCESALRHLDTLSPGEIREAFQEMDESSADMARLVQDLLLLARAGREEVALEGQDLVPILKEVVQSFLTQAAERKVTLSASGPPVAMARVVPGYVRLMARNLIENALQHSDPGGRVEVVWTEAGEVRVRDTGVGLSAADLEHVFEPFWRADRSRARNTGGAGLGLAIVSRLAHAQGGSLQAQSQPGQGSTFAFRLQPYHPRERRTR